MVRRYKDYTGKKYGHLTLLKFLHGNGNGKHATWLAKCDCEKVIEVIGKEAARGNVSSCGNCQYHRDLRAGVRTAGRGISAPHRKLYARYVTGAVRRGIEWDLTPENCVELFKKECTYCGSKKTGKYTGIDRIDSSVGYTFENTVSCCSDCNYMKRTLSLKEFLEKVARIYHRMKPLYDAYSGSAGPDFHKNQQGDPPF